MRQKNTDKIPFQRYYFYVIHMNFKTRCRQWVGRNYFF